MPLNTNGYEMQYLPNHPLAMSTGYVYTHRLLAAQEWGVDSVIGNHVHHKDGNVSNNDIANLEILSAAEHVVEHKGAATIICCETCGESFKRRTKKKRFCSPECVRYETRIEWPSLEELLDMVNRTSYSEVGRTLGVSDNAVRKAIKRMRG